MRWDVFNPSDGVPVGTYRFRFVARLVCKLVPGLEWEEEGKGYTYTNWYR